eukprot:1136722-Pelagomonas_calceolata.AAC.3
MAWKSATEDTSRVNKRAYRTQRTCKMAWKNATENTSLRQAGAWGNEDGGSSKSRGISWYVRSRLARTPFGGS